MPMIRINHLDHYYELTGKGSTVVLIHGAFADSRIWEPQWDYFSSKFQLLRYDLRGHGRTGASSLDHYSMTTFADDLTSLLDVLEIHSPIICGLSLGGGIAQMFAVRSPERLSGLILASSAVSIRLTLLDKILCDVLFPEWAMKLTIKLISVEKFTRFSLGLARFTQGKHWLGREDATMKYLEQCMLQMNSREYSKIWEAIYGFNLLPLDKIDCPTLVLNGEYEPKNAFHHTQMILRCIPQSVARIVPGASHAMNLENPNGFNKLMEEFIQFSM